MGITIVVSLIVLAGAVVALSGYTRAFRDRARVRRVIEEQGYVVRHMGLRWATRGPFADSPPAGLKRAGWLYRIVAEDRQRRTRVAWIQYHSPWPWPLSWQRDRWELRWDESPDSKPRGLSTALFMAPLLVAPLAVILLVMGVRSQALIAAPLVAGATFVVMFLIVAWADARR